MTGGRCVYVGRILKGEQPSRPAVQVLVKYETVLNLKNVKALLRRAGHRASARGLR